MSSPRAWVPSSILAFAAPGELITLTGETAHHLLGVLRLGPGASCSLFDGAGRVVSSEVESTRRGELRMRVTSLADLPPLPGPPLEILVALLKADKLDWVAQKLTELGVDRIVPVVTQRSVSRPEAAAATRRHERLERIIREATRQCGRAHLPRLDPVTLLGEALAQDRIPGELALLCWEEAPKEARIGALLEVATAAPRVRLLVGPEGGLSAAEAAQAISQGFVPASLGSLILRAETAAVAACALAASRIGRLG